MSPKARFGCQIETLLYTIRRTNAFKNLKLAVWRRQLWPIEDALV